MYYLTITLAILLLSFTEFFLVLTFRKQSFIMRIPVITKRLTLYRLFCIIGILIALNLLVGAIHGLSTYQAIPALLKTQEQITGLHTSGLVTDESELKLVGYEKLGPTERYYYVYYGADKSEQTLTTLAITIQNKVCTSTCLISLYDQDTAYILDKKREVIKDSGIMDSWNKQYYVYVAQHYLGYLPPKIASNFNYYPMKDAFYQAQVSKK